MVKVAVGIILKNGKVLVCQRKKSARYSLKWEFPGGKVEGGESPFSCLIRELKEELNMVAVEAASYFTQNYVYPDSGAFEIHYFLVSSYLGTIENRTFEQIRWVRIDELQTIDMLDGNREVVTLLSNSTHDFSRGDTQPKQH